MTRSYSNSDLTGYPAAGVNDPGVYRHGGYHYRTSLDGAWGCGVAIPPMCQVAARPNADDRATWEETREEARHGQKTRTIT